VPGVEFVRQRPFGIVLKHLDFHDEFTRRKNRERNPSGACQSELNVDQAGRARGWKGDRSKGIPYTEWKRPGRYDHARRT
jgi:hypothetical protein